MHRPTDSKKNTVHEFYSRFYAYRSYYKNFYKENEGI